MSVGRKDIDFYSSYNLSQLQIKKKNKVIHMKIKYSLSNDTWDNKEIEAKNRVIASNHFTMGKEVEKYAILE